MVHHTYVGHHLLPACLCRECLAWSGCIAASNLVHVHRSLLPEVVALTQRLLTSIAELGSQAEVDIDRMTQRLTIDIIGK